VRRDVAAKRRGGFEELPLCCKASASSGREVLAESNVVASKETAERRRT
jgi:hypothetical protein